MKTGSSRMKPLCAGNAMFTARSGTGCGVAGFPRISPVVVGWAGGAGAAAPGLGSVLETPGAGVCPYATAAQRAPLNSKAIRSVVNWSPRDEREGSSPSTPGRPRLCECSVCIPDHTAARSGAVGAYRVPVVRASYNRRGQRACPFDHGHLVAFGIHRSHDAFPHTQRRNERGNLNRSTDVRRRLSQNWRRYQRWGVRRRVRFVGHLTYANAPANSNRVTVAEEVRDPI